mgnify:CR=1 FL=1
MEDGNKYDAYNYGVPEEPDKKEEPIEESYEERLEEERQAELAEGYFEVEVQNWGRNRKQVIKYVKKERWCYIVPSFCV